MPVEQDGLPSLLQALTRRAEERAVAVAAALRAAERVFPNGIRLSATPLHPMDEGVEQRLDFHHEDAWSAPLNWQMLAPPSDPEANARVIRLVRYAWLREAIDAERGVQKESRDAERRPDVLALTCDALANPAETHTAELARFCVILSLRAAYRIECTPDAIHELRQAYDLLTRTLASSERALKPRLATAVDHFLIDLLCLDGWLARTFTIRSLEAYYQSFLDAPLGIMGIGRSSYDAPKVITIGQPPEFGEIVNLAFSQPTGVPGLDSILGGLVGPVQHRERPASRVRSRWQVDTRGHAVVEGPGYAPYGGLVTLLVGPPGSGKTSLSLALCSHMAEMGSVARYITTEENREVLESKSRTMADSLATSFSAVVDTPLRNADLDWIDGSGFETLDDVVAVLEEEFRRAQTDALPSELSAARGQAVHVPFPRVVVIDSLGALLEQQRAPRGRSSRFPEVPVAGKIGRHHLARMLMSLRDIGVCVILVGNVDDARDEGMAFLVDNVLALSLECDATPRHPVRLLTIEKTRLQRSGRGSHVFHLGGHAGCSVNPSLHAVLRSLKGRIEHSPNLARCAVLFSDARAVGTQNDFFRATTEGPFTVADRSHTLVYGVGSSGKSRFALALAFEPLVNTTPVPEYHAYLAGHRRKESTLLPQEAAAAERARVLVISFLYEEQYYRTLAADIFSRRFYRDEEDAASDAAAAVEVMAVRPGFSDPEWVVGSVRKRLRGAELDGRPFTAVVIDGLHNVLMQFPLLQRDPLLWATLYRLFRTRGLNAISTFTFFGVASMGQGFAASDRDGQAAAAEIFTAQQMVSAGVAVSTPLFFHLLVSSCDYAFAMARPDVNVTSYLLAPYVAVQLETAPGMQVRRRVWWDPVKLALMAQPPS